MKLLTISEFARLSRLSPKALRLYDDLGLLPPFRVDEWSGYRYYASSQLERARLVAWLRRLGMPLAKIGAVVDAPPAEAAAMVTAFLRVTEAEFSERQRLAQFLIGYFSEGATAMPEPPVPASSAAGASSVSGASSAAAAPLAIRYAAASDIGLVRGRNQDAVAAGPRLVAVADGFGPAGDLASAAAVDALRQFDAVAPGDLLNVLSDAAAAASAAMRSLAAAPPPGAVPVPPSGASSGGSSSALSGALSGTPAGTSSDTSSSASSGAWGSGSTLTAMLLSGSRLGLVHIGDSRAYLFRDGGLFQITHDHSVTQEMIDAGRLTPEEASSHPQRSLLVRALGIYAESLRESGLAEAQAGTADLSVLDARPGDRYLLCSDGLTAAVPVAAIRETLADAALSPEDAVSRLIALANEAGGPDNIACALADINEAA